MDDRALADDERLELERFQTFLRLAWGFARMQFAAREQGLSRRDVAAKAARAMGIAPPPDGPKLPKNCVIGLFYSREITRRFKNREARRIGRGQSPSDARDKHVEKVFRMIFRGSAFPNKVD